MKSLLKFSLLTALIVAGRLAKPTPQAAAAQYQVQPAKPDTSVVLVHQVLTSEPVQPAQAQNPPQQNGSGLIIDLF